jgi:glycosyltransferase involved in cell wall biosynthesis
MVLENEFPPDSRVEKEIISLEMTGYNVVLLCYADSQHPRLGNYKNIKIEKLKLNKQIKKKLEALNLIFPFYRWLWIYKIKKLRKKYEFGAIHIHDLPLSKVGYYFKKKYGLKFVCDQHEFYSNWIVHTAHYNTFLGKIVKKMSNWQRYEKKYLSLADLVLTVSVPLKYKYLQNYPISPEKIVNLPNTPSRRVFNSQNVYPSIINRFKDDYVLFYAGGIDKLRGLDFILGSLQALKKTIPNIKFVIAGRIYKGYDLFSSIKHFEVEDLVDYVGFVNLEKLPSYIMAAKICVFTPNLGREEIHKTIATKIYQYLVMKRPIIVNKAKMMAEFVENNNIGFSVNDQQEFIIRVTQLYHSNSKYNELVNNEMNIANKYYWEKTASRFLKAYKKYVG